jgi:X-X-X-Leu-X-X-Gly heptad repeat protein
VKEIFHAGGKSMFAKTLRGSVFFTFMLIVSMTLTGCNFDIGAIVSGIQNVIGDLGGKLGGFIDKGLNFAKDFVGKAKDFISPVLDAGKEIFKDFAPVVEKIQDGFGKVNSVFDAVGNVSNSIKDVTNAISGNGQDATGDNVNPNAPTNEVVAAPDDEDAVITITPENNNNNNTNTNNNNANTEVSTQDEIKAQAAQVAEGTAKISDGVNALASQLQQFQLTDAQKKELEAKIKNIKENLAKIRQDPTSSEAKALFNQTKNDVDAVIAEAKKFGDIAKGTIDSLKAVVEETKSAFNKFSDAISSIKNLFK